MQAHPIRLNESSTRMRRPQVSWFDKFVLPAMVLLIASQLLLWGDRTSVEVSDIALVLALMVIVLLTFAIINLIRTYRTSIQLGGLFEKHRSGLAALRLSDAKAYQRSAMDLLRDRQTIRRIRPNGDLAVFNPLAGRFVVVTPERGVRTYFAPWKPAYVDERPDPLLRTSNDDIWLSLEEHESDAVYAYFTEPLFGTSRPRPVTVDGLLEEWKKVLNDIWHGYPYSEDDYTNDLVLRDMIADVAALLDEPARATLMEKVDAWDADFKRVTLERPHDQPMTYLLGTVEDIAQPGRWWRQRAPLAVDPEKGWSFVTAPQPADD